MSQSAEAIPHILISTTLLQGPASRLEAISIHAPGTAEVMRSYSMSDQQIEDTNIHVSDEQPTEAVDLGRDMGVETYRAIYSESQGRWVNLYMNNVAQALTEEPPETSGVPHRDAKSLARYEDRLQHAAQASEHLVEAISQRADLVTMGAEGLQQEQLAAERQLSMRTAIPRLLGIIGSAAAGVAAVWLNHKYDIATTEAAGTIATVGTAIACGALMLGYKPAYNKRYRHMTTARLWPQDLRTKERVTQYSAARNAGALPELAEYTLRNDQ
ncbi:MAG TPA: hypothetical protein VD735_04975 [Candidatus Saccharimonadales bacterium]|nr:hypothetical protein [Candidatus Saccharimonadales bacterium]